MRITYLALAIFCLLPACEGETESTSDVSCSAGTTLDADGTSCVPALGDGVEVTSEGTIAPTTPDEPGETAEAAYTRGFDEGVASIAVVTCGTGTELDGSGTCIPTEAYRAAAVEEGRVTGVTEGAASVTPLNCLAGTEVNAAGDGCQPTATYRAAAVEEGRLAGFAEGAASIVPLNCAAGTAANAAGDACEPSLSADVEVDAASGTIKPTAVALEAARLAGVNSVIPLNCAAGTAANAAGDACEPSLSADVEVDAASGTIKPTAGALEAVRLAGVNSVIPLNCAAGTAANAAGDACEPSLSADVEVDAASGTIKPTAGALEAARLAGVNSVIPLNCAAGTAANAAGDACEPSLSADVEVDAASGTIKPTAAALEAARLTGVNSVDITSDNAAVIAAAMPSCSWTTEVWDGSTATCICANDTAVRDCAGVCGGADASCEGCDGIQNSGTVLDVCGVCGGDDTSCQGCDGVPNSGQVVDACGVCGGPGLNATGCCGRQTKDCLGACVDDPDAGQDCQFGMSRECAQRLETVACNPTRRGSHSQLGEWLRSQDDDAAQDYADCIEDGQTEDECTHLIVFGVTSVTCPEGWSFDSMDIMMNDQEAYAEMMNACPNQLVDSIICTPQTQTYTCYGKTCGGWAPNANSCTNFVCETADEYCAGVGFGRNVSMICEAGTICDAGSVDNGSVTCLDGAQCAASTGPSDTVTMNCQSGSHCSGRAGTGGGKTTMNCASGSTCACTAGTGNAQCIMNCDANAACSCSASTGNARCIWN